MNLKGRHFLTLKDYTPEEIQYLVDFSAYLKDKKKKGILVDELKGKNVALIFEKTSTRTRCSFEVAQPDGQTRKQRHHDPGTHKGLGDLEIPQQRDVGMVNS